ncbi:hypothetical protein HHI36_003101 [Cryptolaemus montrouzieri]|uniref:Uncharacterized protein n=1 Tax=Cryptolaemus montrouzieri TaxID=559131 RepID=A0ABD2PD29_9CUCU
MHLIFSTFILLVSAIFLQSVQTADIPEDSDYDSFIIPKNQKEARLELGYDNFRTVKSSKASDIHGNDWEKYQ